MLTVVIVVIEVIEESALDYPLVKYRRSPHIDGGCLMISLEVNLQ